MMTSPAKTWDHPRMCGEHGVLTSCIPLSSGSSPHVRGAQVRAVVIDVFIGIIPACAGSTETRNFVRFSNGDHPRMCGEHNEGVEYRTLPPGSSPHVRGAHIWNCGIKRALGIIPACAGSTRDIHVRCQLDRDHPRMCGEHTSKIA